MPTYPHIILPDLGRLEAFRSRGAGRSPAPPDRDRVTHGTRLKSLLEQAWLQADQNRRQALAVAASAPKGTYIEFRSDPGTTLFVKSLHAEDGIKLLNVRTAGGAQYATVYVPDKKRKAFLNKFNQYLNAETEAGIPKNLPLINSIAEISLVTVRSLWTDDPQLFPGPDDLIWWEVWLRRADDDSEFERFEAFAESAGISISNYFQRFPDRTILLARATPTDWALALQQLDEIAELRRPKHTAAFFRDLPRREGRDWVRELLARTNFDNDEGPSVCILDTGVNNAHPLLERSIDDDDLHSYNPAWRTDDHNGHGTSMAGLALYGDLAPVLSSNAPLVVAHRLESVKILPPPPDRNERELYGFIMAEAASRVELQAPNRQRVFSMAITDSDLLDRGRPSAWSAEIDKLAGGFETEEGSDARLFFVSAGNGEAGQPNNYLEMCRTESVHDPGQAWNAVTVGAFTEMDTIDEQDFDGWSVVAPRGGLCPSSSTSVGWQDQWPIKPDVVYEGGNYAASPDGVDVHTIPSLSLLSTHREPLERFFCTASDTSAATAQAARFGVLLHQRYPDLWPETVRGLMVHSARWTPQMESELGRNPTRELKKLLLRTYGYGVPQFALALESTSNQLTMIRQGWIRPFDEGKMHQMELYALPWPQTELRQLGETVVKLRITLSYFIQPNPGEKGYKQKHRYASHGLRFDINRPLETEDQFRKRLNKAAWEEEEEEVGDSGSEEWFFGTKIRTKGSIHSDVWERTAAELAERKLIGVYPVGGWWKDQPKRGRWQVPCRYSLLVSIEAPPMETDLYVAVENQIAVAVANAIGI